MPLLTDLAEKYGFANTGGEAVYTPSMLGTVPATGTDICVATDPILSELLRSYRDQLFYLGRVYGSKPKMPMWFQHFDSGTDGAGEAYHLGIFGKTGAGKSVLAKMILQAYARHRNMAILILDPQGEFSKDVQNSKAQNQFPVQYEKSNGGIFIKHCNKRVFPLTIRNIVLDTWALFSEILEESLFFERLTMPKGENREIACRVLAEQLQKKKIALKNLHTRDAFDKAWGFLGDESVQKQFYRTPLSRERFAKALSEEDSNEFYENHWKPIAELFNAERKNAKEIRKALFWLLEESPRPVLVIDLSKEQAKELFWNDKIQSLVIKRILDSLVDTAEKKYRDDKSLNTLVVIDEAHRLAPRLIEDDTGKGVRNSLIDAVRTTRKYGLGWMFISQSLSSLHTEIIKAMRIRFFGFGLGLGTEFQSLRELVGSSGTALNLYQSFWDPHSAIDSSQRQYSFMVTGPVSPLSSSERSPLFFNAFNSRENFLAANFSNEEKP